MPQKEIPYQDVLFHLGSLISPKDMIKEVEPYFANNAGNFNLRTEYRTL